MKEFILNDGNWEELEYYVKTKNDLESQNLVLDDIIEYKKESDYHGVDLSTIGSINAILREKNANWDLFLDYFKLVIDVLKLGYTYPDLETLKQKTLEFGGLAPAIRTISYVLPRQMFRKRSVNSTRTLKTL